jgi:hypothetical protein
MKTKIRNEMILTLETGVATELYQSSSRAATAATELKVKHTYLSLRNTYPMHENKLIHMIHVHVNTHSHTLNALIHT